MKIVIDIPEMIYKGAVAGNQSSIIGIKLSQAVKNGAVLPKGHDDALEKICREYLSKCDCCDECVAEIYCTLNGLRNSREPQDYCTSNLKSYLAADTEAEK